MMSCHRIVHVHSGAISSIDISYLLKSTQLDEYHNYYLFYSSRIISTLSQYIDQAPAHIVQTKTYSVW